MYEHVQKCTYAKMKSDYFYIISCNVRDMWRYVQGENSTKNLSIQIKINLQIYYFLVLSKLIVIFSFFPYISNLIYQIIYSEEYAISFLTLLLACPTLSPSHLSLLLSPPSLPSSLPHFLPPLLLFISLTLPPLFSFSLSYTLSTASLGLYVSVLTFVPPATVTLCTYAYMYIEKFTKTCILDLIV